MIPRFKIVPAILFAFFTGCLVNWSLLFHSPLLERDDLQLLTPLTQIQSPADYFTAWKSGKILDVAPVRDLSYFADLSLGQNTFVATNLALWLILIFLALSLFRALGFSDGLLWLLLLVLAAHPIYAICVAWIAARKHLLAAVFILAATLSIVRPVNRRTRLWSCLAYGLSVLSHPIQLLWPVWAFVFLRCERKITTNGALRFLAPHAVVMIALGALNSWYYSSLFPLASGGLGKLSAESNSGIGIAALALARALFNLLIPISLSPVDYFPGSWMNIAGFFLIPGIFLILWKFLPARKLILWSVFSLLPLLLLNLRSTRIFLSDTYLLIPSLGLWILLASSLKSSPKFNSHQVLIVALLLTGGGLWESHIIATSFRSMEALFALAYDREPTPQVSYVHANYLFTHGHFRDSAEIAFNAIHEFPKAESLYAQAVIQDPQLSLRQKLILLKKAPGRDPLFHYFLAKTLAEAGKNQEAFQEIAPGLAQLSIFGNEARLVAAEGLKIAKQAGTWSAALEAQVNEQLGKVNP